MMNGKTKQLIKLIPALLLAIAILVISVIPSPEIASEVRLSGKYWFSVDDCDDLKLDFSGIDPITPQKEQTIMIYIVGADLESEHEQASTDILEMFYSDVDTDKCNVVVFAGGTYMWHNGFPANSSNIFFMEGNGEDRGIYQVFSTEELIDNADPTALSFFLNFAYNMFPAQQYSLVLWDHGSGIGGYGFDEITANTIGLKGISNALEYSPFKSKRLEWIAFDACLMGSLEAATSVRKYANYLIASEEVVSGLGLNYLALGDIGNQMTDGKTAGKILIDETYDMLKEVGKEVGKNTLSGFTFSCINLNKVSTVQKAANALFKKANKDLSKYYKAHTKFINNLMEYGSGHESEMVDFTVYAKFWNTYFPDETKALTDAIKASVTYNKATSKDSKGMSVFCSKPYRNDSLYDYAEQVYRALSISSEYVKFFTDFTKMYKAGGKADWSSSSSGTSTTKASTTKATTKASTTKAATTKATTKAATTKATTKASTTKASTTTKPALTKVTTQKAPEVSVQQLTITETGTKPTTQKAPTYVPQTIGATTGKGASRDLTMTDITELIADAGGNSNLISEAEGNKIKLELTDEQIENIAVVEKVVIENAADTYSIRTVSDDVDFNGNEINAEFDNNVYYLASGGERIPLYLHIVQKSSDRTVYEANVSVCRTSKFSWISSASCALRVVFDEEHPDGYVDGLRFVNADHYSAPVALSEGYVIRSTYYGYRNISRDKNGNIAPFAMDNNTGFFHTFDLVIKDDVTIEKAPVEGRTLYGCIRIRDVYGYEFYTDFIKIDE